MSEDAYKTAIRLLTTRVARVVFEVEEEDIFITRLPGPPAFQLKVAPVFPEEKDKFLVSFDLTFRQASNEKGGFKLEVDFWALFETNEPMEESFKDSSFVKVNAPAIAYPFLRSFVATLITNMGFVAVMLPPINFTQFSAQ
jgi:preprotein translocase subunit SecB